MAYKGVYWHRSRWLARISHQGRQLVLGRYEDEEEAARAYDRAARELHGDGAVLNFPGDDDVKEHKKTFGTQTVSVPPKWEDLKYHPLATLVEFGAGVNLDKFAAFVRRHGYDHAEPITLYRDRGVYVILDGRSRHYAARAAGVTPTFCEYTGNDPLGYVMKKAFRAHLTPSQIAMMLVKYDRQMAEEFAAQNGHAAEEREEEMGEEFPQKASGRTFQTKDELAAASGGAASDRTITAARKVDRQGTPELNDAVIEGSMRVHHAAQVADLPPERQQEEVKKAREKKERKKQGKKQRQEEQAAGRYDDQSKEVPDRLTDTFAEAALIRKAEAAARRAHKLFQEVEATGAYADLEAATKGQKDADRRTYSTYFLTAARKMLMCRPALVCRQCRGGEADNAHECKECGAKGYLTAEEVEEGATVNA